MTFPLRSANLLLLHRELWCSRRASLTKTTSTRSHWLRRGATLGSVKAFHQMTAQPEHIQKEVLGHTQCLSVSFSSFSPPHPPVIPTQRHRRIHRSDKARQQRRRNRDRNWPKGAFLSAYPHQFQHSIKGTSSPYGLNFQSQNPEAGLFQRPWTDGFHPSTLLSSFIFLSTRNSR